MTMHEVFGDPIHQYTRSQAIEDGVLIDVSATAREAGIRYPVAVTARLWSEYIEPVAVLKKSRGQSAAGRLWDTLTLFRLAAQRTPGSVLTCPVAFLMLDPQARAPVVQTVTLKAVCGPGDTLEPVITIMLEHED